MLAPKSRALITQTAAGRASMSWPIALDWIVIALMIFAVSVYFSGGFREYVWGVRISLRSAGRIALFGIFLTTVRHLILPRPSIASTLQRVLERARASEALRTAWAATLATRLTVLLTGYLGVVTVGYAPEIARFAVSDDPLTNLLARWDVMWYLSIATVGYQWDGNPHVMQNVVFFPAFPLALHSVGVLLGRHWLATGVILSTTAFFFALVYLFRLAGSMMGAERARYAVWLVAAYPFAVYYSVPYTESFYLLGAVATFFHLSRAEWWRAAAWGFFLALCRPNGFFIAAPAAMFVAQHVWRERRVTPAQVMACVAPGFGVLAYTLYLFARFGDGLVWMKGQAAWGRIYGGLGDGLYALIVDRINFAADHGLFHYINTDAYDLMHICAAVFVLASLWPCGRRFGWAYAVFVAINIIPPIVTGGMMSIARMTSVLFPSFLWLASALSERRLHACVVAFAVLQGLIAVLFFTWRPVF